MIKDWGYGSVCTVGDWGLKLCPTPSKFKQLRDTQLSVLQSRQTPRSFLTIQTLG